MKQWVWGSIAGGTALYAAGMLWHAVHDLDCKWLGAAILKGQERRSIALTFDDGPSSGTVEVLKLLRQWNTPVTFFQCGKNVRALPQVTLQAVSDGHEIANHTYSHPRLLFKSPKFLRYELAATQEIIGEVTGRAPAWFRPPFGLRWFGLERAACELGLTTALWSVIGMDWAWPADRVVDKVASRLENGSIICLHDGRQLLPDPDISVTLEAVRQIIPRALDLGFRFETLSSLTRDTSPILFPDNY
ncbi:MAG TPA: polysaccharide deacetylase family protein [Candidatus Angelobacter sp.]|nr:polysaccharide deacetylase family protein [Candidatus Angelobacter sp.]